MKNKKLITLICAAVMALGIGGVATACGGNDDGGKTTATVRFNVNTQSETNSVKDKTVTIGKRVTQPKAYILEDNPDNFQVYGWYTDAACTQRWDFKTDRVKESDGEEILRERHGEQLRLYRLAVEELTGKTVSELLIYSFALGKEIKI